MFGAEVYPTYQKYYVWCGVNRYLEVLNFLGSKLREPTYQNNLLHLNFYFHASRQIQFVKRVLGFLCWV